MLRRSRITALVAAAGLLLLAGVGLVHSQLDRARVREMVGDAVPGSATASEKLRAAVRYMESNVGYALADDYYMLPIFRPLRPTAPQIFDLGGDCAYRARALIVLLDTHGVYATKLAVYDGTGESVHAVVLAKTERGDYIVDMLYNIIHEDDAGNPVPLEQLRDPAALAASVERALAAGNERAARYSVEQYPLNDTRTINWTKAGMWRLAHRALSTIWGEKHVANMKRPYLAEEPPLMVAFASACGAAALGSLALVLVVIERRRRAADAPHGNPGQS